MILTQPVPSMQSEADTMKLFVVKGGSDAGQTKNPLKNNNYIYIEQGLLDF